MTILTDIIVIIPVYNCEKYLDEAVESVLNQPCKAIDIVLVDDGSKDGSPALCDGWAQRTDRVHVLHKPNGGVSSARNMGIDYALNQLPIDETTYIAFLDADDAWMPDFWQEETLHLLSYGYDLVGFQSCNCDSLLKQGKNSATLNPGTYPGGKDSVWIHASQPFAAMLYRASLLQDYRIRFLPIRASEDKIFAMQCLYLAQEIYLENRRLYCYRQITTSAVHARKSGLDYYPPILEGYLLCDSMMQQWKNEIRGGTGSRATMCCILSERDACRAFSLRGNDGSCENLAPCQSSTSSGGRASGIAGTLHHRPNCKAAAFRHC